MYVISNALFIMTQYNLMNVLITAAGRRAYLVEYFKKAVDPCGEVICANIYPGTPAMLAADHSYVVSLSSHPHYVDEIITICRKHDVKLLLSCHDLDVLVLSRHRSRFDELGILAVLPNERWGQLCLDKYACGEELIRNGFDVPVQTCKIDNALSMVKSGSIKWPLIIKARMGYGSAGLAICYSEDELTYSYHRANKYMQSMPVLDYYVQPDDSVLIQEYIAGQEYCVDVVNDLQGKYSTHLVSAIHSMRAGESDSGTTVNSDIAIELSRRLSSITMHRGPWGVDVIYHSGRLMVIDVNPRFTGDYPFNHIAGANIPAVLVAWAQGREPKPEWLVAKVGISGYKDLVPKIVDNKTLSSDQRLY